MLIIRDILLWTINAVTIPVLILFLYKFFKLPEKSIGMYMIFILNISSWILPLTDLLGVIFKQKNASLLYSLQLMSWHFAIHWTAALAMFTYLIIRKNKQVSPKKFMFSSLVVCLLLISVFPISIYARLWNLEAGYDSDDNLNFRYTPDTIEDKLMFILFYNIIEKIMPVVTVFYCYLRVYQALGVDATDTIVTRSSHRRRMLLYSIVPILIFGPSSITSIVCTLAKQPFPGFAKVMYSVGYHIIGLLNLWVYWFSAPINTDEGRDTLEPRIMDNSSELQRTLSFSLHSQR